MAESVGLKLFDDQNDFTTDLNAEDIQMIMNPDLKKRRGGATEEAIVEFAIVFKDQEEKYSTTEKSVDSGADKSEKDDEEEEVC